METSFSHVKGDPSFWVSSGERRWIAIIRKLQKAAPDKVMILRQPEENDGCIYAKVPEDWPTIRIPRKLNLSEEQRRAMSERAKARFNK